MIEMNSTQKKAFEIYVESATIENGFVPLSVDKIATQLMADGHKCSRSSVGRWSKRFKWKEVLEAKVSTAIVEDKQIKDLIEASSISASTQKTIDDFKANERLKSVSYQVIEAQVQRYVQKLKSGEWLSHDDEKFMLKVLEVTSNREDKLLDREALLSATKLTNSVDVLKALNDEIIDLEVDDE